ncbi:MAG TPA: hypothetical protein VGK75_09115 [Casimicrobiaceae bacterium]|jgi:hypothetical protein
MKRTVRSHFLAMRASARFGRATKLRDAGKRADALKVARETLAILGHPHVLRLNPAEGSVLCCATVLVEELANELEVPGASHRDIVDALRFIRAVGPGSDLTHWIPHLEQRATQSGESAA